MTINSRGLWMFPLVAVLLASACGDGGERAMAVAPAPGATPVPSPEPSASIAPAPTTRPTPVTRAAGLDPTFGDGGVVSLPVDLRAATGDWSVPPLRLSSDGGVEVLVTLPADRGERRAGVLTVDREGQVSSPPDVLLEDPVANGISYAANGGFLATVWPGPDREVAYLVRLLAAGTPDPAFGEEGFVELPFGYRPAKVIERPGGGAFVELWRDPDVDSGSSLLALDADGSVDARFNAGRPLELFGPTEAGEWGIDYLFLGAAPAQAGGVITAVLERYSAPLVPWSVVFTYYDEDGNMRVPFGQEEGPGGSANEGRLVLRSGFGAADQVAFLPDGDFLLLTVAGLARYDPEGHFEQSLESPTGRPGSLGGFDAEGFVLAPSGDVVVLGRTPLGIYYAECELDELAGFRRECADDAIAIQKFSPDGTPAADFGEKGTVVTDLGPPFGVEGTRAITAVVGDDGQVTVLASLCRSLPGFQKECREILLRYLPVVPPEGGLPGDRAGS